VADGSKLQARSDVKLTRQMQTRLGRYEADLVGRTTVGKLGVIWNQKVQVTRLM